MNWAEIKSCAAPVRGEEGGRPAAACYLIFKISVEAFSMSLNVSEGKSMQLESHREKLKDPLQFLFPRQINSRKDLTVALKERPEGLILLSSM